MDDPQDPLVEAMRKLLGSKKPRKVSPTPTTLQYTPLGKGEIRLLELTRGTQLKGRLVHVKLEQVPIYTALSYVWGESGKFVKIHINEGQVVHATPSLHSVLCHIARSATEDVIFAWVDQICINQNDLAEKSEQVAMMGSIYERAERTVIWLGEDEEARAGEAFGWIQELSNFLEKNTRLSSLVSPGYITSDGRRRLNSMFSSTMTQERVEALVALLKRPWFGRMWVIQEVIRSRSAALIWGQNLLKWSVFRLVMWDLRKAALFADILAAITSQDMGGVAYAGPRNYQSERLEKRLELLLQLDRDFQNRRRKPGQRPHGERSHAVDELNVCLRQSIFFECKLHHDRIVPLLGLCHNTSAIQIDYKQDVTKFYRDIATHLITTSHGKKESCRCAGNLCSFNATSIFSHLSRVKQLEGGPSWIPTWELDEGPCYASDPVEFADVLAYNPCKGAEASIQFGSDPSHLQVQGKVWDRVIACGAELGRTDQAIQQTPRTYKDMAPQYPEMDHYEIAINASFSITMKEAEELALRCSRYGDNQERLDALQRTLCLNSYRTSTGYQLARIPLDASIEYTNMFSTLRAACDALLDALRSGNMDFIQEQWQSRFVSQNDGNNWPQKTGGTGTCTGRRFFITEQGYMGLGHTRMKSGDWVSIFLGAKVPMVIRKQLDGTYKFVGDCYVHGVMDGEVMDMEDYPDETITLS